MLQCWGCNQVLGVPMADPVVQCACCGAYLDTDNGASEARRRDLQSGCAYAIKFPVLFATLIIGGCVGTYTATRTVLELDQGSCAGGGILFCLPWYLNRAGAGPLMRILHYSIAWFISGNVIWNFGVCVLAPVGRKSPVPWHPLPPHLGIPPTHNCTNRVTDCVVRSLSHNTACLQAVYSVPAA